MAFDDGATLWEESRKYWKRTQNLLLGGTYNGAPTARVTFVLLFSWLYLLAIQFVCAWQPYNNFVNEWPYWTPFLMSAIGAAFIAYSINPTNLSSMMATIGYILLLPVAILGKIVAVMAIYYNTYDRCSKDGADAVFAIRSTNNIELAIGRVEHLPTPCMSSKGETNRWYFWLFSISVLATLVVDALTMYEGSVIAKNRARHGFEAIRDVVDDHKALKSKADEAGSVAVNMQSTYGSTRKR